MLSLTSNILSGSLSSHVSDLVELTGLGLLSFVILCDSLVLTPAAELSLNQFSGSIPALDMPRLIQLELSTNEFVGELPSLISLPSIQFFDVSSNQLTGSLPEEQPGQQMIDFDASANSLSGTIPMWMEDITFSVYLLDNGFFCPYPAGLPKNVHVNSECVSGVWYQGVFFLLVFILEGIGFVVLAISVTVAITFGVSRPALLTTLSAEGKSIDVATLQKRSIRLHRTKNVLLGTCVLEGVTSLVWPASCCRRL